VGVSADHAATLDAFNKQNNLKHLLLSDFRRQMLPAYDAMVTDDKSPMYRYGKRAYFVIDRSGTVRYMKVQENPLDLLDAGEVLRALKESGAS
jgi:peroxiredoxin